MAGLITLVPLLLRIVAAISAIWGFLDAKTAVENSLAVGAVDIPSVMGVLPSWVVAIASFGASFIKFNGGGSGMISGVTSILPFLSQFFSGAALPKDFKLSATTAVIPTETHLITLTVKVDPREVPAMVPAGFRLIPIEHVPIDPALST